MRTQRDAKRCSGWHSVARVAMGQFLAGSVLSASAQTFTPAHAVAEAAIACVSAAQESGSAWSATFATNVAEVTFGAVALPQSLAVSVLSIDGTVVSGGAPTGMMAWAHARFDASASGASVEIGRVSGGAHGTGLTNAFGLLAWSDGSLSNNPATVRVGKLDGVVSANAGPDAAVAAAVCARTSVDLTLASGAVLFGGTFGWDAGDGSATNASALLQAQLAKVKARTATPAETNALVAASADGYAVLGGTGNDVVRYMANVAVFGQIALGGGYDIVALPGLGSGAKVTFPPVSGAELLVVTNCPDVTVSNAAMFAELFVGSNVVCRLKDPAYVFAGLYGRGTVVPQGGLAVTNRIEVGTYGEAPLGSALAVTGGLTLGAGVTCSLRAAQAGGAWSNDRVLVSGALTVAGGGTVDLGCAPEEPFAVHTRRVVMTAAGGIVNPEQLASWTLTGTGRDSDKGLVRTVRADGNNIVVSLSVSGTLIELL